MTEEKSGATSIASLKPKTKAEVDAMKPKDKIAHYLAAKSGELEKLIPKHLTLDRLLKVATIAATTTPALAKCDIPSLIAAIGQCAQMGLEPNTVLGEAYLVPFNTKRKGQNGAPDEWVNSVQVIVGYRGFIALARRSGQIISLSSHEVRENDKFDYAYGLVERLEHIPAKKDRGEIVAFYAVAHLKGGGHVFEVMSAEEVEAIRAESQGYQQAVKYKKEGNHPWKKHFAEMGRKTAIRRIAKYLPLSIELQGAIKTDGARPDVEALSDPKTIDGELNWLNEDQTDPETGETSPPEALTDNPSDAFEQGLNAATAAEYERATKG